MSKQTRKVFFDVKFGNFNPAESNIVSISLIKNTGDIFYAIFNDFDITKCSKDLISTLQTDVLPHLLPNFIVTDLDELVKGNLSVLPSEQSVHDKVAFVIGDFNTISRSLITWMSDTTVYENFDSETEIEIWGDYIGISWMFLMSLFNYEFKKILHHGPIPYDLFTLFKSKGVDPYINRQTFYLEHSTLHDFNEYSLSSQRSSMFSSCMYLYCHNILTTL